MESFFVSIERERLCRTIISSLRDSLVPLDIPVNLHFSAILPTSFETDSSGRASYLIWMSYIA